MFREKEYEVLSCYRKGKCGLEKYQDPLLLFALLGIMLNHATVGSGKVLNSP